MNFDFKTRANQIAAQKAQQQQADIRKRDRLNEIAREIVQGLLATYAGRLGQLATVQSNVATVTKQGGATLTVTVLDEGKFTVKEMTRHGGFREPSLHNNLQKDVLDRNGMMDTIIEWIAEE